MSHFDLILARTHPVTLFPFIEGWFWMIDLDDICLEEVQSAQLLLQNEDIERALQFAFEKDRYQRILIYALLKYFLGSLLNKPVRNVSLLRNEFGKPYLQGTPLHFNLSHTKKKALIGIHPNQPIGVDIEEINIDCEEAIFLSPIEIEWLDRHFNNRKEGALSLWCAKEALVKAEGKGFSTNPFPYFEKLEKAREEINILHLGLKRVYIYHKVLEGYKIAVSLL